MNVKIEDYRGWEIYFNTDREDFYTVSNEYDHDQKKRSYSSIRKYIDDYIKDNFEFKPITVHRLGEVERPIKIIGIRKDGRFVYEDKEGKKHQFSSYDEYSYFLVNDANESSFKELIKLKLDKKNIENTIKEIESKVIKFTVKEYREQLINIK